MNLFHKNRSFFLAFVVSLFVCYSCGSESSSSVSQPTTTLTIATAANAQFAMKEIEEVFEALQDSVELELVISSSGKLTAQIQQGAPYDVLLSANMKYPDYLYERGLAKSPPQVYAQGGLVVWSLSMPIDSANWKDQLLAADKIAIANPELAPYGEQAVKVFSHYQIQEPLADKLVFGESISQTNQYILSGACDLGLTAKSVALSPPMADKGNWVAIPVNAYQAIQQGLVVTKYGMEQHPAEAEGFVQFLLSGQARGILEKYGYIVPK